MMLLVRVDGSYTRLFDVILVYLIVCKTINLSSVKLPHTNAVQACGLIKIEPVHTSSEITSSLMRLHAAI